MTILILHSSSDLYGAGKILLLVIHNLLKIGFKPVVVISENGPLVRQMQIAGAEVHIIRLGILRRKYFSLPGIANRVLVLNQAWRKLASLIKEKQVTIIYSNTTAVLIGAFLARRFGLKHVWHVHEIISGPAIFVKLLGYLLNNYSTTVIAVSDAVKSNWEKHVSGDKLVRIHNGIDYKEFAHAPSPGLKTEFGIPADTILIGMIGRVHYWKGQDYFLKIAGHLSRKDESLRFVMVGDAFPGYEYLYDRFESLIKEEGLSGKVYNLGYRTDIADILNSLDIFVLPSIQPDPFPTVILEAMAASKPVVATNHGGAAEMLVDGESGILIPHDNPAGAAERIWEIVTDSAQRERMGRKAFDRLKTNFSIEAFDSSIREVFK